MFSLQTCSNIGMRNNLLLFDDGKIKKPYLHNNTKVGGYIKLKETGVFFLFIYTSYTHDGRVGGKLNENDSYCMHPLNVFSR